MEWNTSIYFCIGKVKIPIRFKTIKMSLYIRLYSRFYQAAL